MTNTITIAFIAYVLSNITPQFASGVVYNRANSGVYVMAFNGEWVKQ